MIPSKAKGDKHKGIRTSGGEHYGEMGGNTREESVARAWSGTNNTDSWQRKYPLSNQHRGMDVRNRGTGHKGSG